MATKAVSARKMSRELSTVETNLSRMSRLICVGLHSLVSETYSRVIDLPACWRVLIAVPAAYLAAIVIIMVQRSSKEPGVKMMGRKRLVKQL